MLFTALRLALGLQLLLNTGSATDPRLCSPNDHVDDCTALTDLASANAPVASWAFHRNWLTNVSVCDWELVGCDHNGRVKVLALSFNNMTGMLPQSISKLSMLQDLDLEYNRLHGTVLHACGAWVRSWLRNSCALHVSCMNVCMVLAYVCRYPLRSPS